MTDIPASTESADTAATALASEAAGATRTWAIWKPLLIVFMASGCTLVLELVAGRIMAPNIGVSIFTWTSIIGVVLLGISLGNYAGGLVADRTDPQRTLGYLLLVGGAFTLAILSLAGILPEAIAEVPFVLRIVLMTAVLFVAPTFVLGMISPIVIKATLTDLSLTGSVAGRIYAFSTFGAIVGTFLTGFVLISSFGTRSIVLGVGVVLIIMGLAFGRFRGFVPGAAGIVLLLGTVAMGIVGIIGEGLLSGCDRETRYFCIKVYGRSGRGPDGAHLGARQPHSLLYLSGRAHLSPLRLSEELRQSKRVCPEGSRDRGVEVPLSRRWRLHAASLLRSHLS